MSKFGNPRPRGGQQATASGGIPDPAPIPVKPIGKAPYRLALSAVAENPKALSNTHMVFHVLGDSGGIVNGSPQLCVARTLINQFENASGEAIPAFLYHLGDVVYYNGQWSDYYTYYFNIYAAYLAPIFAIPGNHDAYPVTPNDPNSGLPVFARVFCDTQERPLTVPGGIVKRPSMIQPNYYWTLQTPLANIIGLYTNVNEEQGYVDNTQKAWFISELKNAQKPRTTKALIVALHHPPYSVDNDHGASEDMRTFLQQAFGPTSSGGSGVTPDIVLSGHVHNYQRFTVNNPDGSQLPYIVCGSSGYYNLSLVDSKNVPVNTPNNGIPNYGPNVTFEKFCDDHWGFMRMTLDSSNNQRTLTCEYFNAPLPGDPPSSPAVLYNSFQLNLITHKVTNLF